MYQQPQADPVEAVDVEMTKPKPSAAANPIIIEIDGLKPKDEQSEAEKAAEKAKPISSIPIPCSPWLADIHYIFPTVYVDVLMLQVRCVDGRSQAVFLQPQ